MARIVGRWRNASDSARCPIWQHHRVQLLQDQGGGRVTTRRVPYKNHRPRSRMKLKVSEAKGRVGLAELRAGLDSAGLVANLQSGEGSEARQGPARGRRGRNGDGDADEVGRGFPGLYPGLGLLLMPGKPWGWPVWTVWRAHARAGYGEREDWNGGRTPG